MKKFCILLAALLCMQVFPITAEQEDETLLFFDDFETEDAQRWECIGGTPTFVSEGENHAYSVTAQDCFERETMSGLRNYSYSFRMKMDYRDSEGNFGNTWPTLRFRVGEDAYYNMYLYNKVGSEEIGLQKFVGSQETWLATASPALTEDNEKWVSVKIELTGNRILVYYKDLQRPIIAVTDNGDEAPSGGCFCFIANGVSAFYLDDLRVERTYPQSSAAETIEKTDDREIIHFLDFETQEGETIEEENGNRFLNAEQGISSESCKDFVCRFHWKRDYYPYGTENPVFSFADGYEFELDSTLAQGGVVLKKDGRELARETLCLADYDNVWTAIGFSAAENKIEFYFGNLDTPLFSYETETPTAEGEISLQGGYLDNWYLASAYRFKPIEIVSSQTVEEEDSVQWKIRAVSHEEKERKAAAIAVEQRDGTTSVKSVQRVTFLGSSCDGEEKSETEIIFTLPRSDEGWYLCYLWDGLTPLADAFAMGEEIQRVPMPPKNGAAQISLSAECDGESFQITGEVTHPSQTVTLLVQKVVSDGSAVQNPSPADAVYLTQLVQTEESGAFTETVRADENVEEGDYRIFAGSDDSAVVWTDVEFLRPSNVSDFLSAINAAETAEEIRALLLDGSNMRYARKLGLRPQLFAALGQENLQIGVISRMLAQKGEGFTENNIEGCFVPHLAFAMLKAAKSGEELYKLLQENADLYSLPELYAEVAEKVQTEALNGIFIGLKSNKYDALTDATDDLEANLILASVYMANYKEIPHLLEQYRNQLGIDIYLLDGLSQTKKASAYRAMNQERCYDYESFRKLYQNAIDAAQQPEPTRKPSGNGGGGGSGGSSGSKITVEPTAVPMQTPEPQKQTVYKDLPKNHWACEAVEYLSEPPRAVVSGYENGNFCPDKTITRAEFVKLIIGAFHFMQTEEEYHFSDVTASDWYAPWILTAAQNGIALGNGECFEPNAEITRQDMAVMLHRVAQKKLIALDFARESVFADRSEISPYAQKAVFALADAGIISGMQGNLFQPHAPATRAQAAKIIYEMIK